MFLSSVVTEHGDLPDDVLRRAWSESALESDAGTLLAITKRASLPSDLLELALSSRLVEVRSEALARSGLPESFVLEQVSSSRSFAVLYKVAVRSQSTDVQRALFNRCQSVSGSTAKGSAWRLLCALCANPSLRSGVALDAYELLFARSTWCGSIPKQTLGVVRNSLRLRRDLHRDLAKVCTNTDLALVLAESQYLDAEGVSNLVSVAVYGASAEPRVGAEIVAKLAGNRFALAVGAEHVSAGVYSLQARLSIPTATANHLRFLVRLWDGERGVSLRARINNELARPLDSESRMACSTDERWLEKQTAWAVRTWNTEFVTVLSWNQSLNTQSCVAALEYLGFYFDYADRRRSTDVGMQLLAARVFREDPDSLCRIVAENTNILRFLSVHDFELRNVCRKALAIYVESVRDTPLTFDRNIVALFECADLGWAEDPGCPEVALSWVDVKRYCSDYTKSRVACYIVNSFEGRPEALELMSAVCEISWSVRDSVEVVLALLN